MKLFTRIRSLLLFFSFVSFYAAGQTASFTEDHTTGCAPLLVHFTNTTGCSTCTYTWNLDDGSGLIHLTDASGSYGAVGTYTVTLTATGTTTTTHSVIITVVPPPVVSFTASDTAVCPGTAVTFTSTSVAGTPGAPAYLWSFGDGYTSTAAAPGHIYNTSGFYSVTLSLTNSAGCSSLLTRTSYIHVFTPAAISFVVTPDSFCTFPANAFFVNTTAGTPTVTYTWRFGDGTSSALVGPAHTYSASGSYNVTVVARDGNGCKDSLITPSCVNVGRTHAAFTVPSGYFCKYSALTFPNTSVAYSTSNWSFGDGNTSTANTGVNTYDTTGVFPVTLIVSDGYCYDTVSHTTTITPGPVASIFQTPAAPCPPPVPITFSGTVPTGTVVSWLYGDGVTGAGVTTTHTYWRRGIDTISMISLDPTTGCKDTVKKIDTLYDVSTNFFEAPTDVPYGCLPLTYSFMPTILTHETDTAHSNIYPWAVTSYTWIFGDGSSIVTNTLNPFPHTYTAVGTYEASVSFATTNGCAFSDSITIRVGIPPPVPTFTATPTHACYNSNLISFIADTGVGTRWTTLWWNFGDGEVDMDSARSTYHSFGRPGIFTVILTPNYNGCPGVADTMTDYITIDSTKASIRYHVPCSPHLTVDFSDLSAGDDAPLWLFGDGTSSTASAPVHTYRSPGVYTVYLFSYNTASGCRDTVSNTIYVSTPLIDFHATDTAICKNSSVRFTDTVLSGAVLFTRWFVDGTYVSDSTAFNYTFSTPGIYNVLLIIEDQNGCLDSLTKTGYMHVGGPHASFSVTPPNGCWPLPASFTDHSTDIAGASLSYTWAFGDGDSSVTTSPSTFNIYTVTGTVIAKEFVTDNIGCTDSFSLPVTIYHPRAVFTASNTHPCPNGSVSFTNTSTGITRSRWTFGDGNTSTVTSPSHVYTASGTYSVTLVVTDAHGCTDSVDSVGYVIVAKPDASFYMSDSVSVCPPLTVTFINTTTGATTYSWKFGDGHGGTSISPSPTDVYVSPAYDTVRLIATNAYGCKDTAYGHVNIYGYSGVFSYSPDSGCAPLAVHFSTTASHITSIVWDFADGITSSPSLLDSITHTYLVPGAYLPKLVLSDHTGCSASIPGLDTIKVDGIVPGFTTAPNPVCNGTTFNLTDTSTSYWSHITTWHWTLNSTTSAITNPSFVFTVAGTYPAALLVTDGWGCTATVSEDITVYSRPVITISPDTTICVGDTATLTGYGGVSYTWADATSLSCSVCNPAFAMPAAVTQYTVTGTDENGCTGTDTTSVSLISRTIGVARGDTQICNGTHVPLFDSGGTKYTWLPARFVSNSKIADPMAWPDSNITYTAITQLAGCIPDTNYVTINVHPVPTVSAGPDQTVIAGATAQLSATGSFIRTYAWDNVNTLSCSTCSSPVASMSVTTTYTIQVGSYFGCTASDSVTVHIFCDNSQLFIPNAFTPNGDGKDDYFYPRGEGVRIIKSFRVYNRWGEMLFDRFNIQINDEINAWDGTYNGNKPKPDVYVYIIDAVCETGEPLQLKGDVTIIR